MSKLADAAGGPALGAAAAAGLVLVVALIIGPAKGPKPPEQDPSGLVQSVPEDEAAPQEAEPGSTAEQAPAEQAALADPAEQTEAEAEADTSTPDDAAQVAPEMPAAPSIDTFRLDPDGALLVAGQASPGWKTVVTLDGADLETVTPDNAGKFVAFLQIEQSDQPRILSLKMRNPEDGEEIASRDEVIIAPTPVASEVAALDEAEAAEPADDTAGDTAGQAESDTLTTAQEDPDAATPDESPADDTTDTALLADPQTTSTVTDRAITDSAITDSTATDSANADSSTADASGSTTGNTEPAQTVLLSNDEGVRVLQPATPRDVAPEVMSSVALDAITYSHEGEVQLSGRGQGEGFVRVYLDNAPITTSRIEAGGAWRTNLPEVDTGVYTLRIDETDAEGNVTSRVETPFKREDEDVIASASAAVAEQRVAAVTVQPGSTLWAISRAAYGEGVLYVRVFEANRDRIRDPDLIYPGQVFSLPE